ncbi:Tim44 domain-containing protein [Massilia haematophila]|uniref:Tim44 domain-containing protein n=1 Tax=Massilia haematophila TaxID=457923 RepID=A0ABV7PNB9_9BURK
MKKFLVTMMLAVTATSMIAEAVARPMGGKRSFGRQSQTVRQMPAPAPAPAPAAPVNRQAAQPAPAAPAAAGAAGAAASQAAKRSSPWKGILGGALLGLGLGALFSHLGIGGAMASVLSSILMFALLALAVMFIVRMFRRKDTPANPSFQGGFSQQPVPAGATPHIGSGLGQSQPQAFQAQQPAGAVGGLSLDKAAPLGAAAGHTPWGVPADFDTEAFLRHAKSSFIRLQAAWDKGDVNDLREFTTPEVFAELKTQILERGGNADYTDVVSIDAQLLGIETTATDYLASVQFNGMIRTAPNAPAEPLAEVWNMSKPLSGNGGWVLAGIQQIA